MFHVIATQRCRQLCLIVSFHDRKNETSRHDAMFTFGGLSKLISKKTSTRNTKIEREQCKIKPELIIIIRTDKYMYIAATHIPKVLTHCCM